VTRRRQVFGLTRCKYNDIIVLQRQPFIVFLSCLRPEGLLNIVSATLLFCIISEVQEVQ
jgi:hypothetical protein